MRDIALANDFNRESGNGLVTTLPGLVAAALGAKKLADAAPLKADIQRGHLLLAAFNALQPGVFALSGWDLVGALPVEEARLPEALLDAGRRYEPLGKSWMLQAHLRFRRRWLGRTQTSR
jgi:hypothetical protein